MNTDVLNIPTAENIVEVYCEWLNALNDFVDPKATRYEPKAFLEGYGWTHCNLAHHHSYHTVSVWTVGDGDEGGPAILTVYSHDDGKPWHIIQEFDTLIGIVMYEGKLKNTQGFVELPD